jgi:rfaE bifunctional protein nucleotidyltransferase chain/domain
VHVRPLDHEGPTRVKTRVRAGGQSIVRVDAGGPGHPAGPPDADVLTAVDAAGVVLVSCYGAGTSEEPTLRAALARRAVRHTLLWDPHPRGGEPVPGCALVTPNLSEARARSGLAEAPGDVVAVRLREQWGARAVAVTGGHRGAWVATSVGEPLFAPAVPVSGDTCGAGDRFASAAAVALARGRTTTEAVVEAVARAGAFVAAGGASALRLTSPGGARYDGGATDRGPGLRSGPRASDVLTGMRRAGGTVVATGGCFDVLHAGHVAMLEAARGLGDCLVVLLNSDASVRRLKGSGRPVSSQEDRARVLRALGCVDDVVVFDEDDPRTALERLRPDVWAKGGDYEDADLPEAGLVRSWGGRVVLLPYLSGRSTTAVLHTIDQGGHL